MARRFTIAGYTHGYFWVYSVGVLKGIKQNAMAACLTGSKRGALDDAGDASDLPGASYPRETAITHTNTPCAVTFRACSGDLDDSKPPAPTKPGKAPNRAPPPDVEQNIFSSKVNTHRIVRVVRARPVARPATSRLDSQARTKAHCQCGPSAAGCKKNAAGHPRERKAAPLDVGWRV
jgi:hypothetical protein